jgi:hypothetical protein
MAATLSQDHHGRTGARDNSPPRWPPDHPGRSASAQSNKRNVMMPITAKAVTASLHVISTCSRRIVLLPRLCHIHLRQELLFARGPFPDRQGHDMPRQLSPSGHGTGHRATIVQKGRAARHCSALETASGMPTLAEGECTRALHPMRHSPADTDLPSHARGRLPSSACRLSSAAVPAPSADGARPVSTLPERPVRISVARRPSVRESDGA